MSISWGDKVYVSNDKSCINKEAIFLNYVIIPEDNQRGYFGYRVLCKDETIKIFKYCEPFCKFELRDIEWESWLDNVAFKYFVGKNATINNKEYVIDSYNDKHFRIKADNNIYSIPCVFVKFDK